MSWGEAFVRALGGYVALVVWQIIGGVVAVFGIGIMASAHNSADDSWNGDTLLFGAILILAALVILGLASLAVAIKMLSDAVSDTLIGKVKGLTKEDLPNQPFSKVWTELTCSKNS